MDIVGMISLSHSPSWDLGPVQGPGEKFVSAVETARRGVELSRPDAIVVFGPDHLRNFFYDLMPSFCIGAEEIEAFGDYSSPSGHFPCQAELARFLISHLAEASFDPAVSLKMGIDHGITQPYAALVRGLDIPLVPIMINCAGPPMLSLKRSFALGQAVGVAIRAFDAPGRVAIVGSGGISHSPPSMCPFDERQDRAAREYAISGRTSVAANNALREQRSIERIRSGGTGPINESWDRWFLSSLMSGDVDPILQMSDDELQRVAGVGGLEIRTWLAALGAWGGPIKNMEYEPVPTWITGMGCISAFQEQ
jgi:2,3-dihydroxyphenylpropionate 1,2-dioxygenase